MATDRMKWPKTTRLYLGDTLAYRGEEYKIDWMSLDDDGNLHIIGVTGPWGCYAGTVKELESMGFEKWKKTLSCE